MALKAGEELQRYKVPVIFTRTEDTFVSLNDRVSKANGAGVAVFVSLHCNAAENWEAGGTEVYYCKGSRVGEALAGAIYGPLVRAAGLLARGVKSAGLYVLRHTRMPATLVELAFISNEKEEKLLRDEAFQAKAAEAVAQGIISYLKGVGRL